ncbi:MAG TPA: hypothetical protein VML96_00670 [Egibacteraceae bacterium]|nr:hypothetical protein [Egibacteraceae bacterium]
MTSGDDSTSTRANAYWHYVTKDGEVFVQWQGETVAVVAGRAGHRLSERLIDAHPEEVQLLLAKASKDFRRGNERRASSAEAPSE